MADWDSSSWLKEALAHAGMSQAELSRKLALRLGWPPEDRMKVNRMLKGGRPMSADEALAISEIADYPLPGRSEREPRPGDRTLWEITYIWPDGVRLTVPVSAASPSEALEKARPVEEAMRGNRDEPPRLSAHRI